MILPSSFFFKRMNDLLKDIIRHPQIQTSRLKHFTAFIYFQFKKIKNPLEKIIILEEAIDTDSSVYELSNHSL